MARTESIVKIPDFHREDVHSAFAILVADGVRRGGKVGMSQVADVTVRTIEEWARGTVKAPFGKAVTIIDALDAWPRFRGLLGTSDISAAIDTAYANIQSVARASTEYPTSRECQQTINQLQELARLLAEVTQQFNSMRAETERSDKPVRLVGPGDVA